MRIINISKPQGWTSFDVVRFVKKLFNEKKVGHLGTLDPIATGVLPVFIGQATRLIPIFNNLNKTYRAVVKLGEATDTFDAEGRVTEIRNITPIKPNEVKIMISSFIGQQDQIVPPYSAVKFRGVPSYRLARRGINLPARKRRVTFYKLDVESIILPFVRIKIDCSKGTYIRALANDLGISLGSGAHLTSLERLACGNLFTANESITIEELKKINSIADVPHISPLKFHYLLKV